MRLKPPVPLQPRVPLFQTCDCSPVIFHGYVSSSPAAGAPIPDIGRGIARAWLDDEKK